MNNKIIKGVTWLMVGGFVAKVFGGVYKILLTRILGGENIGIYQQIFPIYAFLVVLVSAGVPLGVSKLLSLKDTEQEKTRLFNSTIIVFGVFSILVSFILLLLNKQLASFQNNIKLNLCYCILAPAIFFSALTGVVKGYFQSKNNFKPTAVSQILEQLVKIIAGLSLSLAFAKYGIERQIIGAVTGVALGDLVVLIYLVIKYKKVSNTFALNTISKDDAKLLFKTILPIMITNMVFPLSQLVDSILVVRLLNKTFSYSMSTYLYGLQTGVVGTLVNFPVVMIFSITSVLLPNLTRDFHNNDEENFKRKMSLVYRIIIAICIPIALYILIYPNRIIALLYSGKLSGYNVNGEVLSAKLLLCSSVNVVFMSLSQFFAIVLQSRDRRVLPIVNNFIGIIVKLAIEIIYIPQMQLNILGFTIASCFGYFVIFVLNLYEIKKEVDIKINYNFYIKIAAANILTILLSLLLSMLGDGNVNFIMVSILSIIIYFVLINILKIFNKKELLIKLK